MNRTASRFWAEAAESMEADPSVSDPRETGRSFKRLEKRTLPKLMLRFE